MNSYFIDRNLQLQRSVQYPARPTVNNHFLFLTYTDILLKIIIKSSLSSHLKEQFTNNTVLDSTFFLNGIFSISSFILRSLPINFKRQRFHTSNFPPLVYHPSPSQNPSFRTRKKFLHSLPVIYQRISFRKFSFTRTSRRQSTFSNIFFASL